MEIKVEIKETGVYQTLILRDDKNFNELAEAVKQYIILNRTPLKPPQIGVKK